MKEKFIKRKLTGDFNITCQYDDGTKRQWSESKAVVIQHIIDIVEQYEELGYKLTLRQLHYQLVTNNWIVNHTTAYKKLGCILDDCRYAGLVDWDSIEDRGRVPYLPYAVDSVYEALEDTRDQYRRNRQEGQDNIVEVWTEKDALSGIMRRSTQLYHVRLVVNKGYTSSSAIYEAYQRVVSYIKEEKTVTILYFGDHDPSGLDMVRDIRERLYFMLQNGHCATAFEDLDVEGFLKIIPIGLNMKQVKQYKLPANPTKMTDSRSDKYIAEYGKTCWEVDALKPEVLTQILEDNIKIHIDVPQFARMLAQETKDIGELTKLVKAYKK